MIEKIWWFVKRAAAMALIGICMLFLFNVAVQVGQASDPLAATIEIARPDLDGQAYTAQVVKGVLAGAAVMAIILLGTAFALLNEHGKEE